MYVVTNKIKLPAKCNSWSVQTKDCILEATQFKAKRRIQKIKMQFLHGQCESKIGIVFAQTLHDL